MTKHSAVEQTLREVARRYREHPSPGKSGVRVTKPTMGGNNRVQMASPSIIPRGFLNIAALPHAPMASCG